MNANSKLVKQVEQEFKEQSWKAKQQKQDLYLLARQNEDFKNLDNKIKHLTLLMCELENNNSTKANENDTALLKKYEKELLDLESQRKTAFNRLNLKQSSIINLCPICGGSGVLNNGEYCKCFKMRLLELMQNASGLSKELVRLFSDCNLDVFDNKVEIQKIYNVFEGLVKNFETIKYKNIFLYGKSGVGKTYLYSAVAGELLAKGISTFYLTAFNFNNLVLKYHTTFDESKVAFLTPLLEPDALIIDDLGTEQILKNVTVEYLLMILKERNLNNKKTFFNSNLSPSEVLDKYGERIFSRIFNKADSLIINMENANLRLK